MQMCFVLTRRVETLGETNLLFLFQFLPHTHGTNTLKLWLTDEQGDLEGKGTELPYVPFSFYVIIFSVSHRLTQGTRTQV